MLRVMLCGAVMLVCGCQQANSEPETAPLPHEPVTVVRGVATKEPCVVDGVRMDIVAVDCTDYPSGSSKIVYHWAVTTAGADRPYQLVETTVNPSKGKRVSTGLGLTFYIDERTRLPLEKWRYTKLKDTIRTTVPDFDFDFSPVTGAW